MSGIVGKFFFPFGITVVAAVVVSLFVSFTLDPMLSAVWRDPPEGARNLPVVGPAVRWFDRVLERTHRLYDGLLRAALSHRLITLGIAAAAFAVALPLAKIVGSEMMPQADESFTSLRLTLPVGSSLEYADERVTRVEQVLREFKEVEVIDTSIGTEGGKNTARINLKLVPRSARSRSQKELEQAIRVRLASMPGVEMRVGWNPSIYVALLGNDDAEMQRVMDDFKQKVAAIRGVTDLEISLKEGTPALSVRLKPVLASEVGLTHAQLGATLRAFIGGENSGYWLAPDGQNYEVITQLPRSSRTALDDVANLNIATGRTLADGTPEIVPLRSVATIERVFNPENIRRQDLQRRIALFANVQGRPAGDAGEDVKALVKSYPLPPGLRLAIGGQIEDQDEVNKAIVGALLMAVIFIYIVLASQFGSFVQPVAIMASLPLSIVGVMLALLFTGTTLNIFSMIGLVFLMGLVTKNAILLVDFANQGVRRGMARDEALIAAGQVRLRPILMTTTAMIFGMLPLALGLGEGAEQQAPMGRAIIGGVITSTLLTLVVVPVIYTYLDALDRRLRPQPHGAAALAKPASPHED
jgi:multidrug efflux pump subunit AcrB